jgi:hypothetical protein
MQTADLIKYVNNPHLLDKTSVKELQKLVADFPYFQSAHLLLSLASKKWDASVYQQSLKKTAIVATNRSHLFNLIHRFENAGTEVLENTRVDIAPASEVISTYKEDAKQELDILKAAEISTEQTTKDKEETKPELKVEKAIANPEQVLEKEIGKEVVASFVEKEILKTPELHRPKPVITDQPESFGDWLSYLKKNNGEPYSQIEEKVNNEKAKDKPLKKSAEKSEAPD